MAKTPTTPTSAPRAGVGARSRRSARRAAGHPVLSRSGRTDRQSKLVWFLHLVDNLVWQYSTDAAVMARIRRVRARPIGVYRNQCGHSAGRSRGCADQIDDSRCDAGANSQLHRQQCASASGWRCLRGNGWICGPVRTRVARCQSRRACRGTGGAAGHSWRNHRTHQQSRARQPRSHGRRNGCADVLPMAPQWHADRRRDQRRTRHRHSRLPPTTVRHTRWSLRTRSALRQYRCDACSGGAAPATGPGRCATAQRWRRRWRCAAVLAAAIARLH